MPFFIKDNKVGVLYSVSMFQGWSSEYEDNTIALQLAANPRLVEAVYKLDFDKAHKIALTFVDNIDQTFMELYLRIWWVDQNQAFVVVPGGDYAEEVIEINKSRLWYS